MTAIDAVWGHCADGGPLGAREQVGVGIHRIRAAHPALRRLIATDYGIGYHINMDALETKT